MTKIFKVGILSLIKRKCHANFMVGIKLKFNNLLLIFSYIHLIHLLLFKMLLQFIFSHCSLHFILFNINKCFKLLLINIVTVEDSIKNGKIEFINVLKERLDMTMALWRQPRMS